MQNHQKLCQILAKEFFRNTLIKIRPPSPTSHVKTNFANQQGQDQHRQQVQFCPLKNNNNFANFKSSCSSRTPEHIPKQFSIPQSPFRMTLECPFGSEKCSFFDCDLTIEILIRHAGSSLINLWLLLTSCNPK